MTTVPVRAHVVDVEPQQQTAVHVLGGPYVVQDGQVVAVPDGSKRLLVFVALHAGRVDRHHAAGTLWPFGDEARATGNLRSALWRLKTAGIEVIEADKCSLGLRAGTSLDLEVLRAWTARVIDGRPDRADLSLPAWTPDEVELLPGWFDDWIVFERERTRQRVLHAMEALSRRLTRAGRSAEAVEAALYAVRIDPLRETAQMALLRAHLSEGNVGKARQSFLAYSRLLRQELDVTPGREITALARHGTGTDVADARVASPW